MTFIREKIVGLVLLWFMIIVIAATRVAAALDWQTGAGYRVATLPVPKTGRTGFTLLGTSTTGIYFTNTLPESRHLSNANLLNGSGVALGDYDGDGLCDVYLCNQTGKNILYRNLGQWKFEDVNDAAGCWLRRH